MATGRQCVDTFIRDLPLQDMLTAENGFCCIASSLDEHALPYALIYCYSLSVL